MEEIGRTRYKDEGQGLMLMTVINGILDELATGLSLPGDLYVWWEVVC